jgi:hypothetical protein
MQLDHPTAPISLDQLIALVRAQSPEADFLARLSDAVRLSTYLSEQADHLIGHFVDQARRSGASWSQIGAAMGVSKQAAQQRWVPAWGRDLAAIGARFSRFTDRARDVLTAANRLATGNHAASVTPECIVVGLYAEPEAVAAKVLTRLGVDAPTAAARFGLTLPPADDVSALGFDDDGIAVLDATLREALRMGHNYIGTEHLLLGVIAADVPAAAVLDALGVTRASAEPIVRELLADIVAAKQRAGGSA